MRLRDLRWYLLACIILVISYLAIAFCFYLPVRAKAIQSMETLSLEAAGSDVAILNNEISAYYEQFENQNFTGIETDFNKSSYYNKMEEQKIKIATGNEFFDNGDTQLYVFFCRYDTEDESILGGSIPLERLLSFSEFKTVVFTSSLTIKHNTITSEPIGTLSRLLDDESFASAELTEDYAKVYRIAGEEGIFAVQSFYEYYYGVFIPLESAFYSVQWVLVQALIFFGVGVLILIALLVIIILGVRKASVLLRVDRHSVQTNHAIILRVKKDGKLIYANPTFKRLFDLKQIPDVNELKEVHTEEPIFKYFKTKKTIECFYRNQETVKYFQLTPIGVLSTYYLVGSDITEQYERIQSLEMLNGKNEHTGCDNNFALTNLFPTLTATAQTDLAFVEFQVDKWYDVLSLFGNETYYLMLQELLAILKNQFEDSPIYQTRDEIFLVLVPNVDVEDVLVNVRKIEEILRKPFLVKSNHIYVHCKMSVVNVVKSEMSQITLDEVKKRLEIAYNNGLELKKDIIVYNDAMAGVLTQTAQMEEDLKIAIEKEEFEMYLQPQYDIVANKIVGFEALIRWNHPKYLKKSPQAFIELAEQRGYILDISKFVLKESLRIAKQLEDYHITISMNLSPVQILQVGFVNDLIEQFNRNHLKPGSVALEITETFLVENFTLVNEKLKLLKNAGFSIHLDDFCTGYSSMTYLTELPADTIKIDYSFTKYVDTNQVNHSIVSCICTLAKELNLNVICEGVETQAQQEVIRKLGCRVIQGYLISRPIPYAEALKLLEEKNGGKKGER